MCHFFFGLLLTISGSLAVATITLPRPIGKYGTASSQVLLVDHARNDLYAAASGYQQPRRLMLSSFYPTALSDECGQYMSRYMPSATATFYDEKYAAFGVSNHTFASLQLEFCAARSKKEMSWRNFPIVLFSPGLGNSRLIYSAMAQALASEGFIVLTIDHPYDADIVQFPDGTVIFAANITTNEQIKAALDVRVRDVSFVVDQISSIVNSTRLHGQNPLMKHKTLDRVAMFGHSLGGATSAAAALNDRRIVGAANLDGALFGTVLSQGSKRPLLLFAHDGKNFTTDLSWGSTWNATRHSTKIALSLSKTVHGSFTDFPLLVDAVKDLPAGVRDQLKQLVGALPGAQVRDVVSKFVGHFFEYALCRDKHVLPVSGDAIWQKVRVLGKGVGWTRRCVVRIV